MAVLVKHLMSQPVVSLFAEQTLPLAEDIMRYKHLRHLPVVDETGHLVGLVSHRDLLRAQISSLSGLTAAYSVQTAAHPPSALRARWRACDHGFSTPKPVQCGT